MSPLAQIVRMLFRHIRMLILIPLFMAIAVFFLTRTMPKTYASKTIIYTGFVSGYTIESSSSSKVDYHAVNTAFANLINILQTRKTYREIGIELLATHLMMDFCEPQILSEESFVKLEELVPPELQDVLVVPGSLSKTIDRITQAERDRNEFIYELLNMSSEPYSIKSISDIKIERKDDSDMLELKYKCHDPGICKATLEICNRILIRKYKLVKEGETSTVVDYFEEKTRAALGDLRDAENRLKDFRKENRIINYGEQTKQITIQAKGLKNAYRLEMTRLAAAESALVAIEQKTGLRREIAQKNYEVMQHKNKLTELNNKRALADIYETAGLVTDDVYDEIDSLELELNSNLDDLHSLGTSPEGISRTKIVDRWFPYLLTVEEAKINANALLEQQDLLEKQYDHFASLGATVARLERKVKIAEREYLELLHSLNMSKLRQQNLELSAELEVMDWPYFPNKAEATKRMQLVIVAGMLGFMMCVTILILLEFIDRSMQNPLHTHEETGLEVAGAIPIVSAQHQNGTRQEILIRSIDQIINAIKLAIPPDSAADRPHQILFISNLAGEGKSFLSHHLAEKVREGQQRVLTLSPRTASGENADDLAYSIESDFPETQDATDFLPATAGSGADFIFLEIPALIGRQLPLQLLRRARVIVMILNANRVWKEADKRMLVQIRRTGGPEPLAILNATQLHHLESVLGESPAKQHWLIRLFVNLLRLEFTNIEKMARRIKE